MPKRVATPPPGDDEPKYLTVVRPFPLAPNWERSEDREEFARWIACCIGTDPFYAFFYKPRAALSMAIVEIDRTYNHFDRLLGEHRWSEFIKDPNDEERNRVSQVFYCFHNSYREVQKDGWKRINVENAWFKGWSPSEWRVVAPYPATHWCDVPVEDRTNKQLCRPLPVRSFPPPPKVAPPVVGSSRWIDAKSAPSQTTPKALRRAWGNPPRSLVISTPGNRPQTAAKKSSGPYPTTPSSSVWSKSPLSSAATPLSWASPTSALPMEYPSPASSIPPPAFPPGLGPKPARRPSNSGWGSPATSPMPYLTPPGLAYSNQSSSNSDDSGSLQPIDTIHVQTSPSLESALDIMSLAESPVPGSGYVAPWEQAGVDAGPRWDQGAQTQASESLWDDYDAPSQEPVPVLCIAHGVICKKGICMEYDRQLKELAKAQRGPIDSGRGKGKRGERGGRGGSYRRASKGGRASESSGAPQSKGEWDRWDNKGGWGDEGTSTTGNDAGGNTSGVAGSAKGGGSSIGRMRAYSNSSKAESVAPGTGDGWDDVSNGPW